MSRKKIPTVSIGVSAYQSEKNIVKLLTSLVEQDTSKVNLQQIIVYADGCTDKTVELVKKFKKNSKQKIKLIDSEKNEGYSHSVQSIIEENKSDFLLLLNDDILIKSRNLLLPLVYPFLSDEDVVFVCGDILALPPTNFIGRCVLTSFLAFQNIRRKYKSGNSLYSADGKIMVLRKNFSKKLNLSKAEGTGNVDVYIYFKTLSLEKKYKFVPDAKVFCRLPETIADYRSQKLRTKKTRLMLQQNFGEIVDEEYYLPKSLYIFSILRVFLRYPLESIMFKLLINNVYFVTGRKSFKKWKLASSTKKL